jgi:hypothetical protein
LLRRAVYKKITNVSEVLASSIIRAFTLMMEAVTTSETSVNFYQTTRRNNPEDSHRQHYPQFFTYGTSSYYGPNILLKTLLFVT